MLKFEEEGHKYTNIDEKDLFEWVSVTRLIGCFKEPFDEVAVAEKCSKKKTGKYVGKSPEEILEIWRMERNRSTALGSWYHNQREDDVLQFNSITRDGVILPIVSPEIKNGIKYAPVQKLDNGVYPEHFVYLRSANICGQADRVEVVNHRLDVYDYKSNKEIKERGYKFRDGSRKMMTGVLRHLEDCEKVHYALQLSIYIYIILKYNYNLVPGKIEIHHVEFEIEKLDENSFPVYAKDAKGDPVIVNVKRIELPYMKKEVILMLKWLTKNKKMVLNDEH